MNEITKKIGEVCSKNYSDKKSSSPHYEHLILNNEMIKIGFIPGNANSKTIMEIKIISKGSANGQ